MRKQLIKQDMNFLEYPLWFQDKYLAEKTEGGYIWRDREGYEYRAGYKPPVKTDFVFLLYLLLQSQLDGWNETLTLSRYRILKDCDILSNNFWMERLKDSLDRWAEVRIKFKGTFYNGEKYQMINFGIIDEWSLKEDTKELEIRLAPKWILKIKQSNFFKLLDFELVKSLRSPLVVRLYEILIKNFQGRHIWKIDSMKLAQKIPMKEAYPADVIPKIKAGVNRINTHSNLNVKLTIHCPNRGKAMFVFEKLTEKKAKSLPQAAGLPDDDEFKVLMALLPKERQEQKTILTILSKAYNKHNVDYIARNIKYTNINCHGNYRAYLTQALKQDWGLATQEDEEAERQAHAERAHRIREEAGHQRQEEEARARERDLSLRAREYIENLPREEQETLKKEVIEDLEPEMRKKVQSGDYFACILVKHLMEGIIAEKLKKQQE